MGLHSALKARFFVAAVTKRLPLRSTAAAKPDLGTPAQAIGVTVLIHHVHDAIN